MSELKGQLLGVILVLGLFATIAGSMRTVTGQYTKAVEDNATASIALVEGSSSSQSGQGE